MESTATQIINQGARPGDIHPKMISDRNSRMAYSNDDSVRTSHSAVRRRRQNRLNQRTYRESFLRLISFPTSRFIPLLKEILHRIKKEVR